MARTAAVLLVALLAASWAVADRAQVPRPAKEVAATLQSTVQSLWQDLRAGNVDAALNRLSFPFTAWHVAAEGNRPSTWNFLTPSELKGEIGDGLDLPPVQIEDFRVIFYTPALAVVSYRYATWPGYEHQPLVAVLVHRGGGKWPIQCLSFPESAPGGWRGLAAGREA